MSEFLDMSLDQVIAQRKKKQSAGSKKRPKVGERRRGRGGERRRDKEEGHLIFISNLHYQVLEDDIRELFGEKEGISIASIKVIRSLFFNM